MPVDVEPFARIRFGFFWFCASLFAGFATAAVCGLRCQVPLCVSTLFLRSPRRARHLFPPRLPYGCSFFFTPFYSVCLAESQLFRTKTRVFPLRTPPQASIYGTLDFFFFGSTPPPIFFSRTVGPLPASLGTLLRSRLVLLSVWPLAPLAGCPFVIQPRPLIPLIFGGSVVSPPRLLLWSPFLQRLVFFC